MSRRERQVWRENGARSSVSDTSNKVPIRPPLPHIHRPDHQQCKDHQWILVPHTKTHIPSQSTPPHHGSAPTHIPNLTRNTTRKPSSSDDFPARPITEPCSQHTPARRLKSGELAGISTRPRMLRLSVITTPPRVQEARLSGWRTQSKAGCGHEVRDTRLHRSMLWRIAPSTECARHPAFRVWASFGRIPLRVTGGCDA